MQATTSTTAKLDAGASGAARARLLDGFGAAVAERGYAATTIAGIVRHAQVSKRTFYEHFADKEECFLASYEAAAENKLELVRGALEAEGPWLARLESALLAYIEARAARPELSRTHLLEIQAAGPRALKLRRDVIQRFANVLRRFAEGVSREDPKLHALSPAMALAIVGGINELLLLGAETGSPKRVPELAETARLLVHGAMAAPRARAGKSRAKR